MLFGTSAFRNLAQIQAKAMGRPDLPLVLVDHPLGGIPLAEALAKADRAVDIVIAELEAYTRREGSEAG